MTLDEIRSKAPDGATHYTKLNFFGGAEYFKVYENGIIFVWDGIWLKLIEDQYEYIKQRIKPL